MSIQEGKAIYLSMAIIGYSTSRTSILISIVDW